MAKLFVVSPTTLKMATKPKLEEVQIVKLISSDKFEFIIDRKCALASGTIKNMLSSPGNTTLAMYV